jgi:hypothetical protein
VTRLVRISRHVCWRLLLSASLGHGERIYSKSVQDQSVKTEGMVKGAVYGLGLGAIQWSASAF